jgi:polyisoprenoid-binding protein YceI
MTTDEDTTSSTLPTGIWSVDPKSGELAFRARGMFGLATVTGTFSDYDGTLTVEDNRVHGELRIKAASLDTGNAKRDTHLRSPDFFDVTNSPDVVFTLNAVNGTKDATGAVGTLQIRATLLGIAPR